MPGGVAPPPQVDVSGVSDDSLKAKIKVEHQLDMTTTTTTSQQQIQQGDPRREDDAHEQRNGTTNGAHDHHTQTNGQSHGDGGQTNSDLVNHNGTDEQQQHQQDGDDTQQQQQQQNNYYQMSPISNGVATMSNGVATMSNGTANGTANGSATYQTMSNNTSGSTASTTTATAAAAAGANVSSSAATAANAPPTATAATTAAPTPATASVAKFSSPVTGNGTIGMGTTAAAAAAAEFGHMFSTPARGVGGGIGLDVGRMGPDTPMSPVTPNSSGGATALAYPSLVPSMMTPPMKVARTHTQAMHAVHGSSVMEVNGAQQHHDDDGAQQEQVGHDVSDHAICLPRSHALDNNSSGSIGSEGRRSKRVCLDDKVTIVVTGGPTGDGNTGMQEHGQQPQSPASVGSNDVRSMLGLQGRHGGEQQDEEQGTQQQDREAGESRSSGGFGGDVVVEEIGGGAGGYGLGQDETECEGGNKRSGTRVDRSGSSTRSGGTATAAVFQ